MTDELDKFKCNDCEIEFSHSKPQQDAPKPVFTERCPACNSENIVKVPRA